jgi:hypothetical protein
MDIVAGYNSGNVDQIQQRLAPQQNRFYREGGFLTRFINVDDLRGAFQSGFKVKMEVNNLEAAVYGDSAITTFYLRTTVTPPNGTARNESPSRNSYFWNKQDGAWKLVHAHASPLGGALIQKSTSKDSTRSSRHWLNRMRSIANSSPRKSVTRRASALPPD